MSSNQNKHYLVALLKKVKRERGRQDIQFFAEYYLSHLIENETPDFHKEVYELLKTKNRVVIAAPRGFAKSTVVQIVFGIYCLLYNKGEDILSISASSSLAEDWIRKIKFELESNDKIREDFGGVLRWGEKESKRWTSDHLIIHKDEMFFSQIRAKGRGCQVRGLRPSRVFCDDLEDDQLVRSEEQRQILRNWFLSALLNVLRPNQQLVVIGTVLHPLALLNEMLQQKEGFSDWESRKYRALETGDVSLWEDRFPAKYLLKKKWEIGSHAFQSEYQNEPVSADICLFRPEWLKFYTNKPKIKEKFMAIDPAISQRDSADNTGIVVWGVADDGMIYEIESQKGKWGTWDLVDKIIDTYTRHTPLRIGVEHIAFQQILKDVLIKEARDRGIYLPVQPIVLGKYAEGEKRKRVSKDKYSRALTVIHLFEQGWVRLKRGDLYEEISTFPTGSRDDLVDAAVHGLHMILKYSKKTSVFRDKEEERVMLPRGTKSFEVKDNKIPCLAPLEEFFAEGDGDWKTTL